MNRPEAAQMLYHRTVDLADPARVSIQKIIDRDARHAEMRLAGRRELTITVRADPTGHAADCAAERFGPNASDRDGSCFKSPGKVLRRKEDLR